MVRLQSPSPGLFSLIGAASLAILPYQAYQHVADESPFCLVGLMFPGTLSWRWEAVKDGQHRATYQRPESTCRLFTRTVPSADPLLCMGTLLFLEHHDGSSDGISKMLM